MYKEFKIKNFRCFENLEIKNLKRINLFAGKNNVGKTALLESIFIHSGGYNPELLIRVNAFRGIEVIKIDPSDKIGFPIDSIFYNFEISKKILLESLDLSDRTHKLEIDIPKNFEDLTKTKDLIGHYLLKYDIMNENKIKILRFLLKSEDERVSYLIFTPDGPHLIPFPPPIPTFSTIFLPSKLRVPHSENSDRFSELVKNKKEDSIIRILKIVEPSLKSLALLTYGGIPMLYADIGLDSLVPLPLMGEGMVKITDLVLSISRAKNGIVLIDEFENGIYYSLLVDIWKAVLKSSEEFNCQIFATTHSFECIKAAHIAFSEAYPNQNDYEFSFYRLEKIGNKIVAKYYDREALDAAIDIGLEVR